MNLSEVQDLVERAKHRGMNPIERLDSMGLILTDDRRNELVQEVCDLLADRIQAETIRGISVRAKVPVVSPLDVKQAIVGYIRRYFSKDSVE